MNTKIHIDIRNNMSPTIALECVKQVIQHGKVSNSGKSYCYATTFDTNEGEVWVYTRPYRKSDCFLVYKNEPDAIKLREEPVHFLRKIKGKETAAISDINTEELKI